MERGERNEPSFFDRSVYGERWCVKNLMDTNDMDRKISTSSFVIFIFKRSLDIRPVRSYFNRNR